MKDHLLKSCLLYVSLTPQRVRLPLASSALSLTPQSVRWPLYPPLRTVLQHPESGRRHSRALLAKLEISSSSMIALSRGEPKGSWGKCRASLSLLQKPGRSQAQNKRHFLSRVSNTNPKLQGTLISRDYPWDMSLYIYYLQHGNDNTPGESPCWRRQPTRTFASRQVSCSCCPWYLPDWSSQNNLKKIILAFMASEHLSCIFIGQVLLAVFMNLKNI